MAKLKKENVIAGWKIIVKYLRPHQKAVFVLTAMSIVSALAGAAVPYLAGKIIDTVLKFNNVSLWFVGSVPAVFLFIGVWFVVRMVSDVVDWQLYMRNTLLSGEL